MVANLWARFEQEPAIATRDEKITLSFLFVTTADDLKNKQRLKKNMNSEKEHNLIDYYSRKIKKIYSLITLICFSIGGTTLVIYSMMYGILPYFIQNMPALNLTLIGIITSTIVFFFLSCAMSLSAWFAVPCIAIRSKRRHSHPLLPPKRWQQYLWGGVSFVACLLIGVISLHEGGGLPYFFGYIFCAGCMGWAAIDSPDKHWVILLKRSFITIMVAMAILSLRPQGFTTFMNVIVSALGYRSKPSQAILVDDAAYQRLNALTALYNQKPKACLVMIGPQKMWHLQDGTIILQGIGKQTYVSVSSTLPPQPFLPSQVIALPLEGLREKC